MEDYETARKQVEVESDLFSSQICLLVAISFVFVKRNAILLYIISG